MASVNKVILVGNVGKDPEVRQFQDGNQVCNFTLATSEVHTGADGQRNEITTWHNIVLAGKNATNVAPFIRKGTSLYIEGKIRNRSFQTSTGETKYITEIVAFAVQILTPKQEQAQAPAPAQPAYQGPVAPPQRPVAPAAPVPPPVQPQYPQTPAPPVAPQYPQPTPPAQPQYPADGGYDPSVGF